MKGIYLITNKLNGKRYIGLSSNINRRFMEHKTPKNILKKTVLARALKKYGIDNFTFEILEAIEDQEALFEREIFWINELTPEYNMNEGETGNRGFSPSDEMKERLRILGKLQWEAKTQQQKDQIIKNNLKGQSKGHSVSLETREKLRKANIGKKMAQEAKEKISIANKKSMIGNKNGNKKVIAFNESEEMFFDSLVEASKFLNCRPSNISAVINGRQNTSKGYKFIFQIEE
jgi:group I intron endonuclease